MQIIKNRTQIGLFFFKLGFFIELIIMVTDFASAWTIPCRGRLTQLAFAFFCIKILTTHYSVKQWVYIVIAGLIGSISYLTCQDEFAIRLIIMIIAVKGEDIDDMAKATLIALFTGTMVIILLALLGIGGPIVDVREYRYGIVEARYCLGFNHANNVHSVLWYIITLYLYLNRSHNNYIKYLVLTIINVTLFILTKSRTGLIATEMIILLSITLCGRKKDRWGCIIKSLSLASIMGALVITYYSGIRNVYSNRFYMLLDKVLTGRMEMVWEFSPVSEWVLFPEARTAAMVDNGFAKLFYVYGIVIACAYCLWFVLLVCKTNSAKDSIISAILLTTLLVTFMEGSFVINVSLLCTPLVIVSPIIWRVANE